MRVRKRPLKGKMAFFRDATGCIRYNRTCMKCSRECKQSFRARIVSCPDFDRVEDINEKDK